MLFTLGAYEPRSPVECSRVLNPVQLQLKGGYYCRAVTITGNTVYDQNVINSTVPSVSRSQSRTGSDRACFWASLPDQAEKKILEIKDFIKDFS